MSYVYDYQYNQLMGYLTSSDQGLPPYKPQPKFDLEPGKTYTMSRTVKVSTVRNSTAYFTDGTVQDLNNFVSDYKETSPQEWPPIPGDEWESNGVKYITIRTENGLELRAYDASSIMEPVVTEASFDKFFSTFPVCTRRK